ncbi:hypothetical protein TOPH_07370, partial [Tolypocladium ophioglossoides CBS 100239]
SARGGARALVLSSCRRTCPYTRIINLKLQSSSRPRCSRRTSTELYEYGVHADTCKIARPHRLLLPQSTTTRSKTYKIRHCPFRICTLPCTCHLRHCQSTDRQNEVLYARRRRRHLGRCRVCLAHREARARWCPHVHRPQRHREVHVRGLQDGQVLPARGALLPERQHLCPRRRGLCLLPATHRLRRHLHQPHGMHLWRRRLQLRAQVQPQRHRLEKAFLQLRLLQEDALMIMRSVLVDWRVEGISGGNGGLTTMTCS